MREKKTKEKKERKKNEKKANLPIFWPFVAIFFYSLCDIVSSPGLFKLQLAVSLVYSWTFFLFGLCDSV